MKNNKLKYIFLLVMIPVLICLAALNGRVRLVWDYPPEAVPGVTFKIYYSTNLSIPLSNWTYLTNVVGETNIDFDILPGAYFFYATASNFWGETDPSNVALTPAVPQSGNLRIIKLP